MRNATRQHSRPAPKPSSRHSANVKQSPIWLRAHRAAKAIARTPGTDRHAAISEFLRFAMIALLVG